MNTGYMIVGVIVLITVILPITYKLISKKSHRTPILNSTGTAALVPDTSVKWWITLDKVKQLELAVLMADLALPVWEKYTYADTASYRDTSSLVSTTIDKGLLSASLKEIKAMADRQGVDHQQIADYYKQFIGPVIALQDGDWLPPYAVKKIFLSCYNILKGVTENNTAYNENFFAIAIDHSIDCVEITKLYTTETVNQILFDYKSRL